MKCHKTKVIKYAAIFETFVENGKYEARGRMTVCYLQVIELHAAEESEKFCNCSNQHVMQFTEYMTMFERTTGSTETEKKT